MALEINKGYFFARMNLADLYERTGQLDKALEEYQLAVESGMEDRNLLDRIDQIKRRIVQVPDAPGDRQLSAC
jgi:hypothetical protein